LNLKPDLNLNLNLNLTLDLWRGSLLPLACAAGPAFQAKNWGRYAAQREQAPSPQVY
jgi:hypothetical protein